MVHQNCNPPDLFGTHGAPKLQATRFIWTHCAPKLQSTRSIWIHGSPKLQFTRFIWYRWCPQVAIRPIYLDPWRAQVAIHPLYLGPMVPPSCNPPDIFGNHGAPKWQSTRYIWTKPLRRPLKAARSRAAFANPPPPSPPGGAGAAGGGSKQLRLHSGPVLGTALRAACRKPGAVEEVAIYEATGAQGQPIINIELTD